MYLLIIPSNDVTFILNFIYFFFLSLRITEEYETFRDTALKVPEDSREIMDLVEYMKEAQSQLVVDLNNDVKVEGEERRGGEHVHIQYCICKICITCTYYKLMLFYFL